MSCSEKSSSQWHKLEYAEYLTGREGKYKRGKEKKNKKKQINAENEIIENERKYKHRSSSIDPIKELFFLDRLLITH